MTDKESASGADGLDSILKTLREGDDDARLAAVRRLAEASIGFEKAKGIEGLRLLIDVMGDDHWEVRKEAVTVALEWSDKPVLAQELVNAMSEPENIGRRNAVIEGVMRLGTITIDPVLRALKEKPDYRKVLVDVLGTFGDTRVIPALAASLLDEDPNVRAAAMEQLASFPTTEVGPALESALDSADQIVVVAALEGLNRERVALQVARLTPLLDKVALRPAVMTALGHTKDIAALPHLVEGLLDRAKGARESALVALVRLHETLSDPAAQKQIETTVSGMNELALRSTIRALMEATAPVRAATATLLGWSRRRDMVRPLLLVLRDSDAGVAESAAQAIAGMGPVAMEEMCTILPTLDPSTRGIVFAFFQRFGAVLVKSVDASVLERLRAVLSKGLSDRNPETAEATAKALGALGGGGQASA